MKNISTLIMPAHPILRKWMFVFFCFVIIPGCISTGKPQYSSENYLIDYPVPIAAKKEKIDDTLRVSRFTIASAYNNTNMIFRTENYAFDSFNYNRWAVNPADMVGDNLLRDLQASDIFRAAFSRYALDEGRYILQGGVEEFYLRIDKRNNIAVISLAITLKDMKQREATRRIIFQKKYRREELLPVQSPSGYCQAMSQAMQKLSGQIIDDIYSSIKTIENK